MLPPTLRILGLCLLVQLATATAAPTCVSSSEGYQVGQVDYLFNAFCQQLSGDNFASQQQVYGLPIISFEFASASSSDTCNLDNCLASFQSLVSSCALPNSTIWGTGSLDTGCGTYNFTVWNTALNPITLASSPTTTIQGSTLTTAPLITLTYPITSVTISASLTSSISSPTTTWVAATESSSSAAEIIYYSNGTSTTSAAINLINGTGAVVSTIVSGSKTIVETAASTKPVVGSTALGTSGADILRNGGFGLVVVACVFGWWF